MSFHSTQIDALPQRGIARPVRLSFGTTFQVTHALERAHFLTLRLKCDVGESIKGTTPALSRYLSMAKNQAEHFRRKAEDCLDRAEIASDEQYLESYESLDFAPLLQSGGTFQ